MWPPVAPVCVLTSLFLASFPCVLTSGQGKYSRYARLAGHSVPPQRLGNKGGRLHICGNTVERIRAETCKVALKSQNSSGPTKLDCSSLNGLTAKKEWVCQRWGKGAGVWIHSLPSVTGRQMLQVASLPHFLRAHKPVQGGLWGAREALRQRQAGISSWRSV